MTTTTAPAPTAAGYATRPGFVRQLLVDSAYALIGLPLAVMSFAVLIAGFALSAGLLVVGVGLPVLAGTLFAARGFADIERWRIAPVLRRPRVRPHYRNSVAGDGAWKRIFTPITQLQSWLDFTHGVLRLVPAIIGFVLVVTWWALAVAGTLYFAYDWAIPNSPDNSELHELLGLRDTTGTRILFNTAIGVFALVTLPLVVRAATVLQAGFARAMLTGVAEMRNTISTLSEQRAAAVSAEATALRRLERDIHDGPQQRLVRLAMDLGRAQQQVGDDPEAARRTLDEAMTQTRETLEELRALSRGIAPPVLADRGLPSAIASLAGRNVVPVEVAVDPALGTPSGRLDPAVENTAYFVVAESLANAAKHSGATECWVTVARAGNLLGVQVIDNGSGGAHIAKGHGLAGLADRLRANGGTLTVTSPAGGPTEIRAALPC